MSRLVAFWSPSHAGASTLLLNTAATLGAQGQNLVAIDFNLMTPNLALYADLLPHDAPQSACLSRLLPAIDGGRLNFTELAMWLRPARSFPLLPGMLNVSQASRTAEGHLRAILHVLFTRFDLVLADLTPALESVGCLPIMEAAEQICLVVGPEIASRFHTQRNLLPLRSTPLAAKTRLVANRTAPRLAEQIGRELCQQVACTVPHLPAMSGLLDSGRIAVESGAILPGMHRFKDGIDRLASLVAGRDDPHGQH